MREEILSGIRIRKLFDTALTNVTSITDADISAFKEAYKNNLQMPETVRARHILIASNSSDTDAVKKEKLQKAEDTRKKLVDGADFVELAKQYSDCPSSNQGGDLGPFSRGRMVKPFEDAAFAQEVNAIGPVVETQFGYHIIQVTEHLKAGEVPEDKLREIIQGQKKQKAVKDFIDELRSKASIQYGSATAAVLRGNSPAKGVLSAPYPAPTPGQ